MSQVVAAISGSVQELSEHRKAAIDACLELDILPNVLEQFPVSAQNSVPECLSLIDRADVYIGIVGFRYGWVPPGSEKSIVELEYERAATRQIPRLLFLMGEQHLVTVPEVDTGTEAESVMRFRTRLASEHLVGFFQSASDLKGQLVSALSSFLSKRAVSRENRDPSIRKFARAERELLRVFVASPKDVFAERQCMPKVIESLNRTLGRLTDVVVDLWRWEADAPPSAGEPQSLIDPELDKADAVVVIFWNRFGMSTKSGATGTESEVLRSLKRWKRTKRPEVMMYFCQRPTLLKRDELEQRARVLDFREKVAHLALTVDYNEVADFEWRVRDDLFVVLNRLRAASQEFWSVEEGPPPSQAPNRTDTARSRGPAG